MFSRKTPSESPAPEPHGSAEAPPPQPDEDMQTQILRLAQERDEAVTQWKRALADFQNYQRRALTNEQEAKRQGATGVINSVLPVLDHFDLALTQPAPPQADESSRRILDGVKVIRAELVRILEQHGVVLINPQPGEEFDPNRHSAIMQQPAEGVAPGHVSAAFQPGYALGDRVIRSAKVAVAPAAATPQAPIGKPNPDGSYNLDE